MPLFIVVDSSAYPMVCDEAEVPTYAYCCFDKRISKNEG
jgi:hypothetical protein